MRWRDEDPGLPIKLGPCSNGEYEPQPHSPVVAEAIRRAREECARNARRIGMSRREFLLSMMGAATTLLALDACTREETATRPRRTRAGGTPSPGGTFEIPPEATVDPDDAEGALGGDEFILDVQGHLLEYDLSSSTGGQSFFGQSFPQANCGQDDPRACFTMETFLQEFFVRSDTSMVVLSALPIAPEGSPLSPEVMDETRRVAEALCEDERVLLHALALPNEGSPGAMLEAMEDRVRRYPIRAWKTFTHYPDLYTGRGVDGWWLDDHDPALPQVGRAFVDQAEALGVPIVTTHKGFSGGSPLASPVDVGPAARAHPDVSFVAYHSGFEAGVTEGPFTQGTRHLGVNRLVASLRDAGIGPHENVYAEIGSTWWYVMRSPTQAAHLLGKLLLAVGEDNLLWGTDSIWYGSPQDQIQAFRSFQISDELQERYGYPKLTKALKAKVFGLNAARLYGVEPTAVPCRFTPKEIERIRRALPANNVTYGPTTSAEVAAVNAAHMGWP